MVFHRIPSCLLYTSTFEPLFDDPGIVDLSGINWIVVGTMTGAQSRKIHTEPEWAWSLTDQALSLIHISIRSCGKVWRDSLKEDR